jgi:two-component system chemotaxis response regulator CheY
VAAPKVLSVGQCAADHFALAGLLRNQFGADVVAVGGAPPLDDGIGKRFNLILVNRIFDRGGSGLKFIARLKADKSSAGVPVMLVSDLASAQAEAVAMGALPGFGKAALRNPETLERLAVALANDQAH